MSHLGWLPNRGSRNADADPATCSGIEIREAAILFVTSSGPLREVEHGPAHGS